MVIPLMKQAEDEPGADERATLRYGAVWAEGVACAVEARRALRAFLSHAPRTGRLSLPAPLAIDAELVVSELVTNAIRHAPGPCGLILQLSEEGLSITVWDTSAEQPVVRQRDGQRFGGHGMHVVHTVSEDVMVRPLGEGKQITARLRPARKEEAGAVVEEAEAVVEEAEAVIDTNPAA
ncbi:ATP-binding protein [Streptomyces sp. NPDC059696]|uniref:ATP-binding protein n=1 Tax=Streptomyces sp. NPDC059696 TaxID=3346911 RepID=UPI00368E481F